MGPPHASHSPLSKLINKTVTELICRMFSTSRHKSGPEKFLRATSVLCSLHDFSARNVTICVTYRAENTQNQLQPEVLPHDGHA